MSGQFSYDVIMSLLLKSGTPVIIATHESLKLLKHLDTLSLVDANELVKQLFEPINNYHYIRVIDGIGICALSPFIYTVGVILDLTATGNNGGRYCFSSLCEARGFLLTWDGKRAPTKADGLVKDKTRNITFGTGTV